MCAAKTINKRIFLSYCWADFDYANVVDELFSKAGIKLTRDVRDLKDMHNIEDFAQKVKSSSFVVVIVSHPFLISENSMFEVLKILEDKNFIDKLCPIVIDIGDTKANLRDKLKYIKYWKAEEEKIENEMNQVSNLQKEEYSRKLKKQHMIGLQISLFLEILTVNKHIKYSEIQLKGMVALAGLFRDRIKFKPEISIDELFAITDIEEFEKAEEELTRYLKNRIVSENEYYFFTRANVYEKFKYYALAVYNLKAAIKISPNFVVAYEAIIRMFIEFKHTDRKLLEDSLQKLEELEKNEFAYIARGMLVSEKGDYINAIKYFKKAINLNPQNCYAYNNMALAVEKNGNATMALEYYEKALEIKPSYFQARNNYAVLLLKEGKIQDSKSQTGICLEDNPNYAFSLNTKGLLYEEENEFGLAIENYLRSFLVRQVASPLNNIGRILEYEIGQGEISGYFYKIAHNIDEKSIPAIFNLGNYYRKYTKKNDLARALLYSAYERQPQDILCNMAIGLLEYKCEQYEVAKNYFSFALVQDTGYTEAAYWLFRCVENVEGIDEAIDLIQHICEKEKPFIITGLLYIYFGKIGKKDKQNILIKEMEQFKEFVDYNSNYLTKMSLNDFLDGLVEKQYLIRKERIQRTVYNNPIIDLNDAYRILKEYFYK